MYKKTIFIKDTAGDERTRDFYTLFMNSLRERNLQDEMQVVRAADIGRYNQGVVIKIVPVGPAAGEVVYRDIQEADIAAIIDETVLKDTVIDRLLVGTEPKQQRIVLRNCGRIDPENIGEYIANGGYTGLVKVLGGSPDDVIGELKKSGLRGRGGAGYPTWMKWKFCRAVVSSEKFVICNGDEGDPGAYMDRSVLEGDPHSVIEGMIIAAFAVGATKGYFYIRAEYPLAVERIKKAIEQAYEAGILGKDILGSNFSFDAEIRLGAGAFVCGEETALIASMEGKRGTPRPRPPYPSVKGLWDKPTVINNVETLANVPVIIARGGDWFASIGTPTSKGTKVFAVTGKIRNSGLVEVPMGTTLREIVYEICGGTASGKEIKAIQTGGPSGGVIPTEFLDTPVDYDNLQKLGSIMGSGGMIVMDEDDCMADIAKFYLGFCVDESCGKCAPCRIGGYQMLQVLNAVTDGTARPESLSQLKRISQAMQRASLCGLGQTAPNPVLSTIKYFEHEYREHIENKRCPAHKCKRLISYSILQEKCKRCGMCLKNCPVKAVTGDREQGYAIDTQKCTKCGNCLEVCKFKSILKE
jgi:NADP-reducing hydrogenase subunit HndC